MSRKIRVIFNALIYEDFISDTKTVMRLSEPRKLREKVKKISKDIRKKYPEIPWGKMAGTRDKLTQGYFGVDYERIWITIMRDIHQIQPLIEKKS